MIPSDLAARLRLLAESTVNPVAPVRPVGEELPELVSGQRFTARIEEALPEGTFRALVAGRSLTLALPRPATPGEEVELVVTARTPGLVQARYAEAEPQQPPATLSHTARLIAALPAATRPAALSATAPLLPAPEAPQRLAALLAPALQDALAYSGLFYEAHQAQWIAGRRPLAALLREPQARHAMVGRAGPPPATALPEPQTAAEGTTSAASATPPGPSAPPALPAELQTLMQQQLDTLATQHLLWRGELWPGQVLEWEIDAGERRSVPEETAAVSWRTRLRLRLPQLGTLEAVLTLTAEKVSLAMTATAASPLEAALPQLAAAYAAAGLPPLEARVEEGHAHP